MTENLSIVKSTMKVLGELKSERNNFDNTYQDIADYVMLNNSDFLRSVDEGQRRDRRIFDDTAVLANQQLASIVHSGLTDPNTEWARYKTNDERVKDLDEFKLWLEETNKIIFEPFIDTESGFSQQDHETIMSTTGYGTGIMWIADDKENDIIFNSRHLSECWIAENNKGFVDAVYREFKFTARQAVQEWGDDIIGRKLREASISSPEKKFNFIHAVLPKRDYERQSGEVSPKLERFEFISVYINEEDEELIATEGFHEFPYVVPRWDKLSGEKYGRSPSWNTMSDILMVNLMSEVTIKAAQIQLQPPSMVPDDGVLGSLQMFPGGIIIGGVDDEGRELVKPFNAGIRLDISMEMMEQRRDAIRTAFFVDQSRERKGKQPLTATESSDIRDKELRLIGPQVKRFIDEYLSKVINRVFGIKKRRGDFPPLPDSVRALGIDSIDLELEFLSPLVFTQKSTQLLAYNRFFASVGTFVEADPATLQNFNSDKIIRDAAELSGIPMSQMKNTDQVASERQAQAEAQQQQQQMEQVQAGAETAALLQKSGIPIVPEG